MAKSLSSKDKEMFLKRALKAADWFVSSQFGPKTSLWNSDRGRFLYYYYMPEGRIVPGINWTQGRALFVLSDAYNVTKNPKYTVSAELGARYIAALQIMDPIFHKDVMGVIRERTPEGDWCGILDGAQAASGLIMLEKVTGRPEYLTRARLFCDFVLKYFDWDKGLPTAVELQPEVKVIHEKEQEWSVISKCSTIPLWHLYRRTGEKKYVEPVVWAADRIIACQRKDGAVNYISDISKVKEPAVNHHWGRGEGLDRYVLRNDDGIVVVILAAYLHTKARKYLDAAVAYADWIVKNEPHERPFCAFPIQANNVLDVGRVAKKNYVPWVMDNLDEHLLSLQVLDTRDPRAHGGFRGEDEENEGGIFGGVSLDYVPTRTTCYAAGTLFRLSGKGTGAGFSVFGLE